MNAASAIHVGDALTVLRTLPDSSVHCCVTSPPYWNLRDYNVDGQIGLEASVDDWVRVLVAVFDEVRRVLRKDGTLWLNVGDAYVGSGSGQQGATGAMADRSVVAARRRRQGKHARIGDDRPLRGRAAGSLQPKQRLGLPHRLVFALQAAGWWWRDEIVWHKRAPMPESARDRATQSHEFVFLLSKRAAYFFDQEGWKEPVTGQAHPRHDGRTPRGWDTGPGDHRDLRGRYDPRGDRAEAFGRGPGFRVRAPKTLNAGDAFGDLVTRRNRRSVWTLTSEPFREAHFATFPTALVEPCLVAGTSTDGCCSSCGTPRRRLMRKGGPDLAHQRACGGDANGEYHGQATKNFAAAGAENASEVKARILAGMRERVTVGWKTGCHCEAGTAPCLVLDPFAGSGTTGVVAAQLGRSFVGIELNPQYAAMARRRIDRVAPLFVKSTAGPESQREVS